jgi:thioredoxin 1
VKSAIFRGLIVALVFLGVAPFFYKSGDSLAKAEHIPQIPVPNMVTMVDLGAKECIPCKMMAPIMEELEKEYQGRAAVIFIDVWKNPEAGPKFGIRAIPTQIFYDAQGKEITRHEGFLDKESIVSIFTKLEVK